MEENNKVKGYPLFEGMDKNRELVDDEHSTTGDGHPARTAGKRGSTTGDGHPDRRGSTTGDGHPNRRGSTTGDGHPDRNMATKDQGFVEKIVDTLTGEDHSKQA